MCKCCCPLYRTGLVWGAELSSHCTRAELPCMSPTAIKRSFCRVTCVPPSFVIPLWSWPRNSSSGKQGRSSVGGWIQPSLRAEGEGRVPSSEGILPYPRAAAARPGPVASIINRGRPDGAAVRRRRGGSGCPSPRRAVGYQCWAAALAAPRPTRSPGVWRPPHPLVPPYPRRPTELPRTEA